MESGGIKIPVAFKPAFEFTMKNGYSSCLPYFVIQVRFL
jgi:hypothetical protein